MGRVHLAALKASEQISPTGIVEPADEVRANLGDERVPLFASPQELVDAGIAEGVLIAAPSPRHAALVSQASSTKPRTSSSSGPTGPGPRI
jgi:predicted dehydrogenase